jgi:hypothetical protein
VNCWVSRDADETIPRALCQTICQPKKLRDHGLHFQSLEEDVIHETVNSFKEWGIVGLKDIACRH